MFNGAKAFSHDLSGEAWVNSDASKKNMFGGEPESDAIEPYVPNLPPSENDVKKVIGEYPSMESYKMPTKEELEKFMREVNAEMAPKKSKAEKRKEKLKPTDRDKLKDLVDQFMVIASKLQKEAHDVKTLGGLLTGPGFDGDPEDDLFCQPLVCPFVESR